MSEDNGSFNDEAVPIEINGILDLHPFSPKDLKYLIPDYIDECLVRSIYELKIIHGKGTGNVRRSVHALLDRSPHVLTFKTGDLGSGGWGATLVTLKKQV